MGAPSENVFWRILKTTARFFLPCDCMQCNARYYILSVRPSVRRVYCDKTKWWTVNILIPHEMVITLVFWHQHSLVHDAPSLSNIYRKWPTPPKNADFDRFRLITSQPYSEKVQLRLWAFQVDHGLSNDRAIDGVRIYVTPGPITLHYFTRHTT